jgi:signal transduction histidine kinase
MNMRGWHISTAATLLLVTVLVLLDPTSDSGGTADSPITSGTIGALGVLALIGLSYLGFGRRGFTDPRAGAAMQAALLVAVPLGVLLLPLMAVLQCIAFPLLWRLSLGPSVRKPVVLSILLAACTAGAFYISLGMTTASAFQGIATEIVSLGLGLGIGLWMSSEIDRRIENERLVVELTAAQQQLGAAMHEAGAAAERERLALELHDTIAQSLTSLVMLTQRAQARLGSEGQLASARNVASTNDPSTAAELELIEEVARDALGETRALVAASAPVEVAGGLAAALERIAGHFRRETGLSVVTQIGDVPRLSTSAEVVLLRAAQEALANVRKHSGASTVLLSLDATADTASLIVTDDGRGPGSGRSADSGFGLAGMQQRLGLVGGTMTLEPAPGGGARLTATLPVEEGRS